MLHLPVISSKHIVMKQLVIFILLVLNSWYHVGAQQLYKYNLQQNGSKCIYDTERIIVEKKIRHNIDSLERLGMKFGVAAAKIQAPQPLAFPINYLGDDCEYYEIIHYVDNDPTSGILDYNCGSDTYDGHMGVDIDFWPLPWYKMDNDLIEVIAAASGTILAKQDGNYDRNCEFNPLSLANYVIIEHDNGSRTWYWHLKNGSVTSLAVGTYVTTGTYLGVAGSSGASIRPHLHFEVHKEGTGDGNLVDPYYVDGACNNYNNASWWITQPPYAESGIYSTTFHSVAPFSPLYFDCPLTTDYPNFDACFAEGDTIKMYVWGHNGTGTPFTTYLYRPDGSLYGTRNFPANTYEYWYYNYNFVLPNTEQAGVWRAETSYGGKTCSKTFNFKTIDLSISGNLNTCPNRIDTYTTASIANITYTWTVIGGIILSGQGSSTIQVQWSGTEGSVSVIAQ